MHPAVGRPLHTYAVGARVLELPVPIISDEEVIRNGATLTHQNITLPRSKNFRRLNHCWVPGYAPFCLDLKDSKTSVNAYAARLLRTVPRADPGVLERLKAFTRDWLEKHVPVVTPYTDQQWLEMTSYPLSRKAQLWQSAERNRHGPPSDHDIHRIDSFIKREFYMKITNARTINSRSDAFKVYAGGAIRAIEDVLYGLKSDSGLPYFVKHTTPAQRMQMVLNLKKSGVMYYSTDYTAFESHFVPEVMDAMEVQLFKHCLQNHPRMLKTILKADTGRNRMSMRHGIKATVMGRRMSGDLWTSLGNGFSNLMLALFIAHEKGGILEGMVEGDDGLFSCTVPLDKDDFERCGFTIKIEQVNDPCEASFCGLVFSNAGQVIREPRKVMSGFGWTHTFIHAGAKIMDQLLRAKALSLLQETPHCPIVAPLAHRALAVTQGVTPRFVADGYHQPSDERSVPAFSPTLDTRLLFQVKYGISVQTQLAAEAAIAVGDMLALSRLVPNNNPALAWYARAYQEVG